MTWVHDLTYCLSALQPLHDHLCPRQVLGVRIGLHAARLLNISLPRRDKRVFCFVETDGCFADGVMVATGCSLGHRTLRLVDYGKVAAAFIDTTTGRAFRIFPRPTAREAARDYAPDAGDSWHTQLIGYQVMPDDQLLCSEPITLTLSIEAIISRPGRRVTCHECGEEILNQREVIRNGDVVCLRCAGDGYYRAAASNFSPVHGENA
jgi:formylmethanofuran dehydrogenase subunit E